MRRLAFLIALVCTLSQPASATIVATLDTRALVAESDQIVRGRVVAQMARWDDAHERIFTDVTIRVDETYKGARTATLLIRRQGGSVGGIGMRTIGEVEFAAEEEAFLFLRRIPHTNLFQTVALAQGKLRIVRDRAGARVVSDPRGATLMTRDASGNAVLAPGRPSTQPLAGFEAELRRLVGARR